MSIKEVAENGRATYTVNISMRSKIDPKIRSQKRKTVPTLAEAKRVEKSLREAALREIFEREQLGCTWGVLVRKWEESLPKRGDKNAPVSPLSGEDYAQVIETWTKPWWTRPAEELGPGDVKEVMNGIISEGKSRSTQEKLRSAINAVFGFGMENRYLRGVSQSPAMGLKLRNGRDEEKRPEILTHSQIRSLIQHAKAYNSPWRFVWTMALLTGMRSGELQALTWSDVDIENKLIHVHRNYNRRTRSVGPTKGRYWRDVPISSELEQVLTELRAQAGASPFVLPRIPDWERGEQARFLRWFCKSIGIPSVRFHTLRACFATQLLRNGVPSIVVMRIGGWKTLKTMERYIRIAGVEITGATEGLNFVPPQEALGKVVSIFQKGEDPIQG